MNSRIKALYPRLSKAGLDGLIVFSPANTSYLTETRSRDAFLVVSPQGNAYLTDSRYLLEAKKNITDFSVREIKSSLSQIIAGTCRDLKLKRVGFEKNTLVFAQYEKIRQAVSGEVELVPTHGLIEDLRKIKSSSEFKLIRRASEIAVLALDFIAGFIAPGRTELEIAGELERHIRYQGAYSSSFDIIVASGSNSCFAHHLTGLRKLKPGDLVLIDVGVDYLGYKSDLTRIFFLDKINPLARKVYAIIQEAQEQAIRKVKPGVAIEEIDTAARHFIAKKGYGPNFIHSTGHGIGLEVHEAPHITRGEKALLKPGMVFTVEPAIYLAGKFGMRLEDMVLVTSKGAQVISGTINQ